MTTTQQANVLTRLEYLTAISLSHRLAVDGFEPVEAREAVERYIGRPLASVPLLYSKCRTAFQRGQGR